MGIVEELRHEARYGDIAEIVQDECTFAYASMCNRAADEIESLTTANKRLREALEEAIIYGAFPDLCWKWQQLLKETKA